MELKDQFREGYAAGREAYEERASKTPFWDRLIFFAVLIGSMLLTQNLLARYSALGSAWRFVISVAVPCALAVPCSLFLDWLRKRLAL
jgi:hypothetical protein